MTWSVHISGIAAKDAIAEMKKKFRAEYADASPEVVDQFVAAMAGLQGALKFVQPDRRGLVSLSANGHANPDHKTEEGLSSASFAISLTHAGKAPAGEVETEEAAEEEKPEVAPEPPKGPSKKKE